MSELPRTPDSAELALPGSGSDDEALRLAPLADPFKFVYPDAPTQCVSVHVEEGTIWATPNGGAVRGKVGCNVRWTCNTQFTLRFAQLGGTKQPLGEISSRPVDGAWVAEIKSLASGALPPYYEYTVTTAEGLTLDPIVIVDKH